MAFKFCAQLAAYYQNPGRGYMCTNKDIVKKVANIDLCSVSYYTANAFKYIYLNEILQMNVFQNMEC